MREKYFLKLYLSSDQFLLNNNIVPVFFHNIVGDMSMIFIIKIFDVYGCLISINFMNKNFFFCSNAMKKGKHTWESTIVNWMNDQIKTDTEEWTPAVNFSNLLVLFYFGPNIKSVVNMKILPE